MAGEKFLNLSGLQYFTRKLDEKKADIESPAFTGTPTVPTPATGNSSTQAANTAFVAGVAEAILDKIDENQATNESTYAKASDVNTLTNKVNSMITVDDSSADDTKIAITTSDAESIELATEEELDAVKLSIEKKQDSISDLETIRSGAALGTTALQEVPSTYRTAEQQDAIHDATKADQSALETEISERKSADETLTANVDNATSLAQSAKDEADENATAISTHKADTAVHITDDERTEWSGKQDAITDLEDIRNGAKVFWCTYGVTTYEEITEALNNGMIPYVRNGAITYRYNSTSSGYTFIGQWMVDAMWNCVCTTSSRWSCNGYSLQTINYRENTITDSESKYPSSHAVVAYAEPKKDDWVLKGTWTDPTASITLDLTGCTELDIKGTITGTATGNINADKDWFIYQVVRNGDRTFHMLYKNGIYGYMRTYSAGSNSATAQELITAGFDFGYDSINNKFISDIKNLSFSSPSTVTSCNISIYAR